MFKFAMLPDMGNNLKKLRKACRMTQDSAADAMGVSKGQYIKLERSERRLTLDYITRAGVAFGVPASEVIQDGDVAVEPNMNTNASQKVKTDFSVKLADLFAKVMRLNTNQQAQIIAMVEDKIKSTKNPEKQSQSSSHG